MDEPARSPQVEVVGTGPAGLSAAPAARALGDASSPRASIAARIRFPGKSVGFVSAGCTKQTLRRVVEMVLSKQLGSNYGIRCVVETQQRENPNALREQIRSSRKDQHVKAAINIFDADIIAVETHQEGD